MGAMTTDDLVELEDTSDWTPAEPGPDDGDRRWWAEQNATWDHKPERQG